MGKILIGITAFLLFLYCAGLHEMGEKVVVETTWHSLLISSWGQFRLNKKGKGRLFFTGELPSIAAYGYCVYLYEMTKNDIDNINFKINNTIDPSSLSELKYSTHQLTRDLNTYKDYRNQLYYII